MAYTVRRDRAGRVVSRHWGSGAAAGGPVTASYHDWASGRYHDPRLDAAIAAWPRRRAKRLWRQVHGDVPMTGAGRREALARLRAEVDAMRPGIEAARHRATVRRVLAELAAKAPGSRRAAS